AQHSTLFPYTTLFRSLLRLVFVDVHRSGSRGRHGGSRRAARGDGRRDVDDVLRHAGRRGVDHPPVELRRAAALTSRGVEGGENRSEEHTSELQSLAYL